MKFFSGIHQMTENLSGSIVTIGNFDGLHQGHQKILGEVRHRALQKEIPSLALTFVPHPISVLFPERDFRRLFDEDDQRKRFQELGIDIVVQEAFTKEFSSLTALDFLNQWILEKFKTQVLVVGEDFNFGARREGTLSVLREYCKLKKIELVIVPQLKIDEEIISSSGIKKNVEQGDVKRVSRLLGRHFYLLGVVEKGDRRGSQIGFPTANLSQQKHTLPAPGVYATRTEIHNEFFQSVTNLGYNPTFKSNMGLQPIKIETHILDFERDIYGEKMRVEFIQHIRGEQKFSGVGELVHQIQNDILVARRFLNE